MFKSSHKKFFTILPLALLLSTGTAEIAEHLFPVSNGQLTVYAEDTARQSTENRSETETETETETEALPDARALWYNEHVASMPVTTISKNGEAAPFRLARLAETAEDIRAQLLGSIRVKIGEWIYQEHSIILSEVHSIHFVCTDDVDYAVIHIGDAEYICQITYTDMENMETAEVTDTEDVDEWTLATVRSITSSSDTNMDIHYWNGYVPFDIENPDGSGSTAAQAGLAVDPASLLHMDTSTVKGFPETASTGTIPAVPYFNQGLGYWDGLKWMNTDWPNETFSLNGHTMHEAGCGFFAAAMAISYFRQEIVPPVDFMENGQYIGDGSAVTVSLESAGMYEVPAVITGSWEEAYAALQAGHLVMENVGPGVFARYGHFIMLTGILDDGKIVINDPGNEYHTYWYNWETFDAETCRDNRHDNYTAFTIFG